MKRPLLKVRGPGSGSMELGAGVILPGSQSWAPLTKALSFLREPHPPALSLAG